MNKFNSNINYLRQYVNGELSSAEMYEVERAMHQDEMLMDIIQGLEIEKQNKLYSPVSEIQQSIKSKGQKKNTPRIYPIKKIALAASLIGILGFTSYYFYTLYTAIDTPIASQNDRPNTMDVPPLEMKLAEKPNLEASAEQSQEQNSSPRAVSRRMRTKKINKDKEAKIKIAALSATPKLQVIIEKPKYLQSKDTNHLHIAGLSAPKEHSLLASKDNLEAAVPKASLSATAISGHSTIKGQGSLQVNTSPVAGIPARPQQATSSVLGDDKSKELNVSLSEILLATNTLTRQNNASNSIRVPVDSYQTIAAQPTQNGHPEGGWPAFHLYIKQQLEKFGFNSYQSIISFQLDQDKLPIHIEIKSSSNPELDKHIIQALKQGPKWEDKNPNHPIFIRLNSQENNNF